MQLAWHVLEQQRETAVPQLQEDAAVAVAFGDGGKHSKVASHLRTGQPAVVPLRVAVVQQTSVAWLALAFQAPRVLGAL